MSPTTDKLSEKQRALLAARLQKARSKPTVTAITRRPDGTPPPLSFAQRRLWFLYQWEPDNPSYNVPLAFRLTGALNVAALEQTFNVILRRHEVLHMVYITEGDEVRLAPHPAPTLTLAPVDFTALPPDERTVAVQAAMDADVRCPFNLEHDLMLRAKLLRLTPTEHVLLLNLHHIAADGWSLSGVLVKEWVALYSVFCAGESPALPEPEIQYADFAYWQRQWFQGDVLKEQLDYWKQNLAGAPAVLELPTHRPRPPELGSDGAMQVFAIDPALDAGIKSLAQRTQTTPFMVWLAGFAALLSRYTSQDDIVVGAPIAGRNRSEIEDLIGLFVNTLVLRTDLSGDPTVETLLGRVREAALGAYAHQDLPFEKLVEELHPERALSHHPLFQVMFNYHNLPEETLELPNLTVHFLNVDLTASKFDLSMTLAEKGGELVGHIVYNTDLFDAAMMRELLEHYQTLMAALVAHPDRPISELALLTSERRAALVAGWMDTAELYPEARCMHEFFEAQVARTPDAPAIIYEQQQYTYAELNAHANRLAHHLQTLGVGPDVCVGLYMEKSLDTLVALLGILKAGGAYVPLDPLYPPERVRLMMEDAGAGTLLTEASLAAALPRLDDVQVVRMDTDHDVFAGQSAANPPIVVTAANLFYVLFTSGSTGRPKGVAVEYRNYLNYFHGVMRRIKPQPGMQYAMVSTFSTDLGTIQFWAPLTTGGTTHIVAYERATDPEAMVDYFCRHRIDVLKLVPSHYDALQGIPEANAIVPRHLVIFTGEASHWGTVARVKQLNPQCMVQDHYGVTETTCATLVKNAPDVIPEDHVATLPLGEPLGNVCVYTLDQHLEPTPPGVPGELCIGGRGVTRGYFGRPGLTAERFVPDPFSVEPGARMYRTGDLAYFRYDGSLKLLGRMDFQIKIRGYRIEAGEIETLLCERPAVQDAVVIAREDTPGDRRLVAYVVPLPLQRDALDVAALREALRARLPDYMVPSAFVILDAIPLNPNGKVDRFRLPQPEYSRLEAGTAFVAPRNEDEARIAAVWCAVLGLETVGIDDNFFDVGGESFKAIRAVRKIGQDVSVMDLFKHPTIRGLAALTSAQQDSALRAGLLHELTQPISAQRRKLTLVCVPYGGGSAITYRPLAEALPGDIALYAVQLPGHDFSRKAEALQRVPDIARQCAEEIKRDIHGPLALYGHCVGAALVLEIARLLEADGVAVLGLYLAGAFPTARIPGKLFEWWHRLFPVERWTPTRDIYEGLRALGGFAEDMGQEEREFVLKSIRHDALMAEEYYTQAFHAGIGEKLKAPVLCIVGERDRATELYRERFHEWEHFSERATLAVVPQAGHYFLKHQAQRLAGIIAEQRAVWQGEDVAPTHEPVVTTPRPTVTPSIKTFLFVVLSQFISLVGTGLTAFGLGVWVYQQTGSLSSFAAIQIATFLPGIFALPFSGALADRWDRRKLMIVSDALAGCGTLLLAALLWSNSLQLWHIYILTSIASLANAFQRPAYMAAVTQLVPKQYLGHANGFVQLGAAVGDLVASFLGGALLVVIGLPGLVIIDLVSCAVAIVTLLLIRFPDTLFRRREESFLKEITGGWSYIVKRPGLVTMVVYFTLFNYFFSLVWVIATPLTLAVAAPGILGIVLAMNGAGVLAGGFIMGLWGGAKRRAEGMVGYGLLYGLAVVLMGIRPSPVFVAVGMFGIGVAVTIINAHWLSLIQSKVGLELQGRVLAMNQMLGWAMIPIGFITADPLHTRIFAPLLQGPLATTVGRLIGVGEGRGLALMMVTAGAALTLLAFAGYNYRPLRYMEDKLPDAIPDAIIIADKDELQALADRQQRERSNV